VANQQNVLVKLSAEGEEQVVAAFAKMAEGAKKSGKEAEGSLAAVKQAATELGKTLTGLFALERVVHGFGELVKGAIETGESLARVHAQTGIGTDALQAYAYAARRAGLDGEQMTQSMGRLARAIFAAQQGSAGAATALSAIGLHVRDFIGLTPEQQFEKVATALGTMEDHTKAQAAAMALLGRGGAVLLPVFREVAENGIGYYVERLKELGIYQSTELIAQLKDIAERLKDVKAEAAGAATQFATGFLPAVVGAFGALDKAMQGPGVSGLKEIGRLLGEVVRIFTLGLVVIGAAFGSTFGEIVQDVSDSFDAIGRAWEKLKNRDFAGAGSELKGIGSIIAENSQDAERQFRDRVLAAAAQFEPKAAPAAEPPPTGLGGDVEGARAEALSKAREQLQQQLLDNELRAYKEQAAQREAVDKAAFEKGTLNLQAYFDDRVAIVNERAQEEIDVLKRKRAAAAAVVIDEDDEIKAINQRREIAKLDGEIAAVNATRAKELAQLDGERFTAIKRNQDAQQKAEETLAKIRGDHLAAQTAQLNKNLEELDRTLAAGGTSPADRTAAVETARQQGQAAIDFGDAARTAKEQFADLKVQLDAIKQLQEGGQLFPIEAEQQILATERQRLPILQQTVAEMTRLAALSKDSALAEQAKQAADKLGQLGVSVNTAGIDLAKLKQLGQQTFEDGLTKAVVETIAHVRNAGAAFKQFGLQLAQALEQAIVKLLIVKALQAAAFGGGGSVGAGGGGGSGFAEGGHVPGVGNSDSVPAFLTPGEFVVQKEAASQPAVRALLEAINGGALRGKPTAGVQHFAAGGFVAGSAAAPAQFKVINVLDPSTLGDHLATAQGEQAIINIMARHPNRIREALG
jgi:hypothetical protein